MKKILEILKQIYQKLCSFIQWSKKFYFFHFIIVYLLPSNLLTIFATLITPICILEGPMDDTFEFIGSSLFIMFLHSICAILFGLVFQTIAMIIKFALKRTVFVTSNFLHNNKIYDKIYCYSIIIIIISWLTLYLFKVI